MPAIEHEVDEALEEGIEISLLVSPVRLVREANGLRALVACRMRLGEADASGRLRPLVILDSEFEIAVDSVIAAVSQEPDIDGLSGCGQETGWLITDDCGALGERVWAGGDALELGIAGTAIAHGRRAAEALDAKLRNQPLEHPRVDERPTIGPEGVLMDFHVQRPAARPSRLTPEQRLAAPGAEVSAGIGEEQFLDEAARCFSCGSCGGCQQCWMYCSSECFTRLEEVKPGVYFTLSLDKCQECGKCAEICPCGYIEVT
jgi:ferredoxin